MAVPTVTDSLTDVASGRLVDINDRTMRLSEVTDVDGFRRLQPVWDATLQRDPDASVFQTWEWQFAWWKHFGKNKKPLILLISDQPGDEHFRAIAPMMLKHYVVPGIRELTFIGAGISDYLDIVCHPDWRLDAAAAVFDHLRSSSHKWDFIDLHQLPPGDTISLGAKLAAEYYPDFQTEILDHEVCPVVPLPESWEEYRKLLGKSLRFNIGYYERSLRKQHDVEIGIATEENLDEELDALFHLHTSRWRRRCLPGVLCGANIKNFHKEVARKFLERGWLRLYYLKVDGKTCASHYCFSFKNTMYYYLGGFDPKLAKFGLGTILTAHAIRQAIEEGMSSFDMLRGSEDYKRRWQPEHRTNSRLFICKPDLRSRTARALHSLEGCIEHAFKERIINKRRGP
ncbi:MAG: GNAT family N-acetyltransferase [Armatimonadota bacterium]|nr:GNAT family N-acetyltransferase [Armatimonadota bacterium]